MWLKTLMEPGFSCLWPARNLTTNACVLSLLAVLLGFKESQKGCLGNIRLTLVLSTYYIHVPELLNSRDTVSYIYSASVLIIPSVP